MKIKLSQKDFMASVVVFLVALPLCMGIALASGVSPAAGLVTGVIGGIVVGLISGSPLQVSGPAAGLSVLVWQLLSTHGLVGLAWITVLAGLIQILAASLKLGQWFRAVSPAVLQGMLAGIGVLIIASQFYLLADLSPKGSGLANILGIFPTLNDVSFDTGTVGQGSGIALMVGLLCIGSIMAWNKYKPKKLKSVPGSLVGVVVATSVVALFGMPVKFVTIPENIFSEVKFLSFEGMGGLSEFLPLLAAALGLAFVASAESLLCASAVDEMHSGEKTKFNKELFAQGVGNTLCGFLGALPMTGVIVRSAANVESGAQTRWSSVLHGIWILVFVVLFPFVLKAIPMAALAGVLVFTGFKLVQIEQMKTLLRIGKSELAVYFVTLVGIVAVDLLTGVCLGIAAALLRLLIKVSRLESEVESENEQTVVKLRGNATFLHIPQLSKVLEKYPVEQRVRVETKDLVFIDSAAEKLLRNWHRDRGSQFVR